MTQLKSWKEHYWYGVPCQRARIEEVVRRATGAVTILETGCNEGFLSMALIEAGFQVTSLDLDPVMIAKAKEAFGIDVVHGDINYLPFSDNHFDLAIGGEVLEHLDNPGRGLSELFRVSKDRVIISLPIGAYWLGEKSHKWQIEGVVVEHDQGILQKIDKQMVVIEFIKRKSCIQIQ